MAKAFVRHVVWCFAPLLSQLATSAGPEAEFRAALQALADGKTQSALAHFETALVGDPDNLQYGSEYRQAVIQAKAYDPSLKFFKKLVAEHPNSANARLNYGLACVDKLPAAGMLTRAILGNSVLTQFTKAVELSPSWLAYYVRGDSYLYWPRIFRRARLGIRDLEQALNIQRSESKKSYHVRVYVALGDGYLKMDDVEKAEATWREGLREFPNNEALKARLSRAGGDLKSYVDNVLDPDRRVDTNLKELWTPVGLRSGRIN